MLFTDTDVEFNIKVMRFRVSFYNLQHSGFTVSNAEKAYLHKYAVQNEI